MKKFQLIALLVCALGFCSAFVSRSHKKSFGTFWGWSYYPGHGPLCYSYPLDWGTFCDKTGTGAVCTIGGGGYLAYNSSQGCQYKIQTDLLYRVY